MAGLPIPEQLFPACYYFGRLPSAHLLLQRNAALPWFILFPETTLNDVLDLPPEILHPLLADCAAVSSFLKSTLDFPKTNFAGLGNVLPDMHLHVVGRRPGDACWPQPVWGNLPDGGHYADGVVERWQNALVESAGLQPASLTSPRGE